MMKYGGGKLINKRSVIKHSILILFVVLVLGCGPKNTPVAAEEKPGYENKIERKDEPDIIEVTEDDEAMNKAIEKAIATLPEFNKALKSKNPNYSNFNIKVNFEGEHMWVGENWIKNGDYYGTLSNDPEAKVNQHLHFGDTLKIDNTKISDWQYLDGNKLVGGYTIRVLRDKMTEKERADFDKECGFTF